MPTLILPRSRFLHIPKTGGVWVSEVLKKVSGLNYAVCEQWDGHLDLHHAPGQGLFTFAFVRHPLHWWRSYWAMREFGEWANAAWFCDVQCRSSNYAYFIECVLDKCPGMCSDLFETYVGTPEAPIDFVGRQENLQEDLITALKLAGEVFNEPAVQMVPPLNVGRSHGHRLGDAVLPPKLEQALVEAEWRAMTRFGYADVGSDAEPGRIEG
jgi:hypothetical protein